MRDDQTLVFLHLPKCAGTSLTRVLDGYFEQDEIYPVQLQHMLPEPGELADALKPYRLVRGYFRAWVTEHAHNPVVVTMLRHPVARVVSGYHYLRRRAVEVPRAQWSLGIEQASTRSMMEWLQLDTNNDPGQSAANFKKNHMTMLLAGGVYPDDEMLEAAKATLDRCTVVGLSERFAESVDLMTWTLGLPYPQQTKALNVRPMVQAEAPEVYAMIRQLNPLDIELYNYARLRFEHDLGVMDFER